MGAPEHEEEGYARWHPTVFLSALSLFLLKSGTFFQIEKQH